ncbi:MAG: LysR family transcriptional regulator [Ktedonobacterales bacterium]
MDFVYLRTLCEVARCGSLTHAANALGYAQSSVTTQMQKLEEQYGVPLFERHGRKLKPTQAGETLIHYAQQILALHSEAKAALSQQETGTLTIGVIETLATYYLPPILRAFRQDYPNVAITLQAGTEPSIVQAVKDGRCDLGLVLDLLAADPDLVCVPLRKEEFVVVVSPESHYSQACESMMVEELAQARLILTEEGCTYRALLLHALKQCGVAYQIAGEFGSIEAIKQCVASGVGIAFLPRAAVETEIEQGKLRGYPLEIASNLHTQAVYLKRKWQSRSFQRLLSEMSRLSESGAENRKGERSSSSVVCIVAARE